MSFTYPYNKFDNVLENKHGLIPTKLDILSSTSINNIMDNAIPIWNILGITEEEYRAKYSPIEAQIKANVSLQVIDEDIVEDTETPVEITEDKNEDTPLEITEVKNEDTPLEITTELTEIPLSPIQEPLIIPPTPVVKKRKSSSNIASWTFS